MLEGGPSTVLEQTGYVVAERPSVPTWVTENEGLIRTKISIHAPRKIQYTGAPVSDKKQSFILVPGARDIFTKQGRDSLYEIASQFFGNNWKPRD